MFPPKILLFCTIFAVSIAFRRDDWEVVPEPSPEGLDHTTGAAWDYRTSRLYYLAPAEGKIYIFNPHTNKTKSFDVDFGTVFIQLTEDPNCLVYGVENKIKTVELNDEGYAVGGQTLATIEEAGPEASMKAGAVSTRGNLTFIIQGTAEDKPKWFIYTMALNQRPFKLNFDGKGDSEESLDSLFWACKKYDLSLASSVRHLTFSAEYFVSYGYINIRHAEVWDKVYLPTGETKEDMEGDEYQIMNYDNNDLAEIFQIRKLTVVDYLRAPFKKATSIAFGDTDMKTLFITSQRSPVDKGSHVGGLYSCNKIGRTGRPAFIALSSLNPDIDYCATPMPHLLLPGPTTETSGEPTACPTESPLEPDTKSSIKPGTNYPGKDHTDSPVNPEGSSTNSQAERDGGSSTEYSSHSSTKHNSDSSTKPGTADSSTKSSTSEGASTDSQAEQHGGSSTKYSSHSSTKHNSDSSTKSGTADSSTKSSTSEGSSTDSPPEQEGGSSTKYSSHSSTKHNSDSSTKSGTADSSTKSSTSEGSSTHSPADQDEGSSTKYSSHSATKHNSDSSTKSGNAESSTKPSRPKKCGNFKCDICKKVAKQAIIFKWILNNIGGKR